jgi:hypothetical protein
MWVKNADGDLFDLSKALRVYSRYNESGHVTIWGEFPTPAGTVLEGEGDIEPHYVLIAHYDNRDAAEEDMAMICAALKPAVKLSGTSQGSPDDDDE